MKGNEIKGILLALSAAILWGVSGSVGQFLFQQRGVSVEWLITTRMLVAGFGLLIFTGLGKPAKLLSVWKDKKDTLQLLIFSITGMLAVQYTYFAAIKYSNAATATVLQSSGPILIAAYLALKNRRVPTKLETLAILLAVAGTFTLVTHGNLHSLNISGIALFFGIATAVTLAIYTLQPIELLTKYDSSVIMGWGMLIGGIAFSFIHAPWKAEGVWDLQTYAYTGFVVIFGTLIAFNSYMKAVTLIGGQKASLLASAEPLAAAALSVFWLNTRFIAIDWIGSLCILATVFVLSYQKRIAAHVQ